MATEQKIEKILTDELKGASVLIEHDSETGKVGGRVIWEGFQGYNSLRRQNRIFRLLRRELTTGEAQDISFIFTYTPAEYANMQAA